MAEFLAKLCRTCMSDAPAMLSIFDDSSGDSSGNLSAACSTHISIFDKLCSMTNITASKDDGLPENICLTCIGEVNRAYAFKVKCEQTETTLKSYIHQNDRSESKKIRASGRKCQNQREERIFDPVIKSDAEEPDYPNIPYIKTDLQDDDEPGMIQMVDNVETVQFFVKNDDQDAADTKNLNILAHFEDTYVEIGDPDDGDMDDVDDTTYEPERIDSDDSDHKIDDEDDDDKEIQPKIEQLTPEPLPEKVVGKIQHKCGFCGLEFVRLDTLQKHNEKCHKDRLPIDRCRYIIADDTKVQYECTICSAKFVTQVSLKNHQRLKKCNLEMEKCDVCGKVFVLKVNLMAHKMTVHSTVNDKQKMKHKHQCLHCGKGFTALSSLKDHLRIHNGETPYLCPICGRGFSQNTNLNQHMMRHRNIKNYKCNQCTQSFVSKGELNSHVRKHTGEHPFVCDICGTGLTTSSSLLKHKRIHSGERPYACEYCPMRFNALSTLKNHRRTHTGERPYACQHCDRSFAQRSDCVSHMRTHTGERSYVCTICGMAFVQSAALKTHQKVHNRNEEQ